MKVRSLRAVLVTALVLACTPAVAAAQGSGDYASFGPSSPNSAAAYNLAVNHIGSQPCVGHVTITWYPLGTANKAIYAFGPTTGYPTYGTISNPCVILVNYDEVWNWAVLNPYRGQPQESFCAQMYNAVAALSRYPQSGHVPSFCLTDGGNPPFFAYY